MASNGIGLLMLLPAFFFLVCTQARNLDVPVSVSKELSSAPSAKKQGPISSSEGTGYAKGVSVSYMSYNERGHDEYTRTHETWHPENVILKKSGLLPQPELLLNEEIMSSARDTPFSEDEESFLPILSHSEDALLHKTGLYLHDDHTIPSYLAQNGLPIGLIPSSVASYSITTDGDFIICLQEPCYAKFDYEVYYAHTITGKLSYGTITALSGIQAKEAFFWIPVTSVRIDTISNEYIYFDAGPISKKLSISQFQTTPVCKVKAMASSALA